MKWIPQGSIYMKPVKYWNYLVSEGIEYTYKELMVEETLIHGKLFDFLNNKKLMSYNGNISVCSDCEGRDGSERVLVFIFFGGNPLGTVWNPCRKF